jgi:amidase
MKLVFKSALALGRMLKARKISSRELLQACLDQYAAHNSRINAVIATDFERAWKAADAADRRLRKKAALSPFDGVPMTAKESFDWAGQPSTWGDPELANNIAKTDAVALTRMCGAGAVPYGKTNVPLALADWQSFNAIYGTTNNPWDVKRRLLWQRACRHWKSAPTSAPRSAIRRITVASMATSRPMASCPIAAT